MAPSQLTTTVRRINGASVIDLSGDVTGYAEDALMAAYHEASVDGTKTIVLNFTDLDYMNSSGIGLLVTLLIRVQRQEQQLRAFGLSDHYQQIFELTRLNEAIAICDSEEEAVNDTQDAKT